MTVLQGFLLGLLQGIAEFLPISSSGHLALAKHLFGLNEKISANALMMFDIVLHVATLCAVVLYYRAAIVRLLAVLLRWILRRAEPASLENVARDSKYETLAGNDKAGRNTICMVLLSTVVTGAIGVLTAKIVPDVPPIVICMGFEVTAILLILSAVYERAHRNAVPTEPEQRNLSLGQALFIGLAQGIGTLPGISRSGSTIAGALFCGVDRVKAGDYSFIISIPAILGAFLLDVKDLDDVAGTVGIVPLLVGCVTAFISGLLALTVLMKIIHKGRLELFAAYLVPVGILGIIFF